jgi:hypothetical protein
LAGFGLILNLEGTIFLVFPFFKYKIWETDDEEEIPDNGWGQDKKGKHWFTRKGLIKNRKINIAGLVLIFLGFLLQFFALFP